MINSLRNAGKQGGFTLIELSMVVAIIGIIAAIAMPYYRDYVEDAHAAEALAVYHGIVEEAQSMAQESGSNICDLPGRINGVTSPVYTAIRAKGDARLKDLNPKLWYPNASHILVENSGTGAAVTGSPFNSAESALSRCCEYTVWLCISKNWVSLTAGYRINVLWPRSACM